MKINVPITYRLNWHNTANDLIPLMMEKGAAVGMKNIVLTEVIMQRAFDLDVHEIFIKSAANAGLTFVDAHAPYGETELLGLAPEKNRRAMLRHMADCLAVAAEFGCKTCTMHVWNWRPDSHNAEERFGYVCDSLEKLLPFAEKYDVTIALENVWCPPCTADMLIRYVKEFNSPNLGLCYDSGHAFIFEHGKNNTEKSCVPVSWNYKIDDIPWEDKTLEKMLPWLVNCHLHDNDGFADQHILPGRGDINWDHVVNLLAQAPKLKCIQSEAACKWDDESFQNFKEDFEKIFK